MSNISIAVFLFYTVVAVSAQFSRGTGLYQQLRRERNEELLDKLKNHPELENIYFPGKNAVPTDFYVEKRPSRYTMNVIFDPCRGQAYNCCNDTFGSPEYFSIDTNTESRTYGQTFYFEADGRQMSRDTSRRPGNEVYIKESCTGKYQPTVDCINDRVAARSFNLAPKCWNYDTGINAFQNCRAPHDGSELPLCLEIGFTQTAFIIECGGRFAQGRDCGTFLEIHKPGDETIISETKLRGQYTSGYRMTVISMTYKGNSSRVLCGSGGGKYEIWWVLRTRHNWIIQKKIPFQVELPECQFDFLNNRYFPYTSVDNVRVFSGLPQFDPQRFAFNAPAGMSRWTSNSTGAPGMGAAKEASAVPYPPPPKPLPKQQEPLPAGSYNETSGNNDWNGPALPWYDYHIRDPRWGGGVVGQEKPPPNPNLNFLPDSAKDIYG